MRIVFFGSSGFSVPSLRKTGDSVVAVVTKKAKPKGRGYQLDDNEVKRAASEMGLPLIEIDSFRDEEAKSITDHSPDLFIVVSFGLMIPRWALNVPSKGPINIHPSLLPLYRGPSPIQWALLEGDNMTGVTLIRMNEKMDEGDIIYQEQVPIRADDNYITLSERLSLKAADALPGILDRIDTTGMAEGVRQDHSSATYAPMITREMGRIDWQKSAAAVDRQVKALVRWPAAFTTLDGKLLKIFDSAADSASLPKGLPGTVTEISKEGLIVSTGKGVLTVRELQMENKKRMPAYNFSKGYRGLQGKLLI